MWLSRATEWPPSIERCIGRVVVVHRVLCPHQFSWCWFPCFWSQMVTWTLIIQCPGSQWHNGNLHSKTRWLTRDWIFDPPANWTSLPEASQDTNGRELKLDRLQEMPRAKNQTANSKRSPNFGTLEFLEARRAETTSFSPRKPRKTWFPSAYTSNLGN